MDHDQHPGHARWDPSGNPVIRDYQETNDRMHAVMAIELIKPWLNG